MNAAVQEKQQKVMEKQAEVKEAKLELRQENRKKWVEQAKECKEYDMFLQQMTHASSIIDTAVKNFQGDELGDIKDLMIHPESGHIIYAVISFGGVFGLGGKLFAVPWKALHWTDDKLFYVLNVDKASLEKAPGFDKNHWPTDPSAWHLQREELDQFYSITI